LFFYDTNRTGGGVWKGCIGIGDEHQVPALKQLLVDNCLSITIHAQKKLQLLGIIGI